MPAHDPSSTCPAGPILLAGAVALTVIEVIRELNSDVSVIDRGSYLRVSVPGRCILDRGALESRLGRPFRFPGDLEAIMPSFQGRLVIDEHTALWDARAESGTSSGG